MIAPPIPLSVKVFFACSVVMVLVSGHAAFQIWRILDLAEIHGHGQIPSDQIPDAVNVWFWRMIFNVGAFLIGAIIFLREIWRAHGIAVQYVSRKPSQPWWVTVVSFFVPILNFYLPWRGLNQIHRALTVSARNQNLELSWKGGRSWPTFLLGFLFFSPVFAWFALDKAAGFVPKTYASSEMFLEAWRLLLAGQSMMVLVTLASGFYATWYLTTVTRATHAVEIIGRGSPSRT